MKTIFRVLIYTGLVFCFGLLMATVLPARAMQSTPAHPVYLPLILNQSPQAPILITGKVTVTNIFANGTGKTEPDEYVEIKNEDTQDIQLQNWKLVDNQSHWFTFPSFIMKPGQVCRVYTNEDQPQWCGFSYHNDMAIWNNSGDCAYLHDPNGTVVSKKCY